METPISMVSEKPSSSAPPKMKSISTTTSVVAEVMMVRLSVCVSETLTISYGVPRRILRKFSRIRSETTILSFSE